MVGVEDPTLAPRQAQVRIEYQDGRNLTQSIEHPSGSPQRPLSDAQLAAKFTELACRALAPEAAARLYADCRRLYRLPDLDALTAHWMRPGTARAAPLEYVQ
jgi:2-methylcitrate dehydratase PrpD